MSGIVCPAHLCRGALGLETAGAVLAGDLSAWKARVLLMVLLARGSRDAETRRQAFSA